MERLYSSAPGAGWTVMDDLRQRGGLGGALSVATGYAHNPLRIDSNDGSQHLSLVRHQAFFEFGAAVTYDRFRFYFNASSPLLVQGDAGSLDGYRFAPGHNEVTQHDCGTKRVCADLGWNPDTIADPRIGFDARLYGEPDSVFRMGLSTQFLVPSGFRSDYLTDNTFRAMDRVLFAGDVGGFTYAGHVGVHIRPLNDGPSPGSPRGSELLFGAAAGPKLVVGLRSRVIVGPELFGASAFRGLFEAKTTALEALLSGRWETVDGGGIGTRVKAGVGAGLSAQFGAPEWRGVIGVEMFSSAK